ncbi:hypothetical protein J421_1286 [Gemmatirosa kalamazoonensis]|jgi:hypothetical protein|uniref:Uncharacterized protein n=1 Tax=Gemmatirosa kalamazoonensis TaxID=861299 RepID=W0RHE5_9BACT|nr:hypothetical protein [Gemmatirosa kalamazoonensis]AHG88823.1 hypothetical protein J421_1286 [Gemmatirosa kalamazoonensis]
MWSDTFLSLERAHFYRIVVWGAACVVVGTALLALAVARRQRVPLVRHFALQTAGWGAVDVALALLALRQLRLPDYAAATRFDRFVWWSLGIDLGGVAVGATLALAGWLLGRRLGAVGAGLGVAVQGLALAAIDLVVIGQIGASV